MHGNHDVRFDKPLQPIRKRQAHPAAMADPRHLALFRRQQLRNFRRHPLMNNRHGLAMPCVVAVEDRRYDVVERIGDQTIGQQIILTAIPDIIETALPNRIHLDQIQRHDVKILTIADDLGKTGSRAPGHVVVDDQKRRKVCAGLRAERRERDRLEQTKRTAVPFFVVDADSEAGNDEMLKASATHPSADLKQQINRLPRLRR